MSVPAPDSRASDHRGLPGSDAPSPDDGPATPRTYWLFETGTGRCVILAEAVRHCIERATVMGLPTAGPRFDAALVHESNQMMPAIDLRARRGEPGSHPDALILHRRALIGLVVDRIVGTVALAPGQIHALNATQREQLAEYVSAVTFMNAQPVAVLDPDRLFAEDDLPEKTEVSRRLDRRRVPR